MREVDWMAGGRKNILVARGQRYRIRLVNIAPRLPVIASFDLYVAAAVVRLKSLIDGYSP